MSGGLCGSVFLDLGFQKYIEILIGTNQYSNIKESYRKTMMKEFEYGIKRAFTGKDDQTYSIDLRGVQDDPANGVIDETIIIKMWVSVPTHVPTLLRHACHRSVLRTIFDHVFCQIGKLVDDQIAEVSEKGLPVKVIIPRARKSRAR